ncbi:MAG: hypothetical protein WCS54_00920 [Fibrobacteraceae bacterium]
MRIIPKNGPDGKSKIEALHVENVHPTAPYARVIQDSTVFNFSCLLLCFVP